VAGRRLVLLGDRASDATGNESRRIVLSGVELRHVLGFCFESAPRLLEIGVTSVEQAFRRVDRHSPSALAAEAGVGHSYRAPRQLIARQTRSSARLRGVDRLQRFSKHPVPAVGEMQVARVLGRDVCFVVIAVLSSDCRDAS
jgi:hypothetical protein